jgi:hypothetical protein
VHKAPEKKLVGAFPPFPRGSGPAVESIPVRRHPFPTASKAPAMGGLLGRSPITPEKLIRDEVASEQVGRFVLPFLGTAALTPWVKLNVERPTILMSLGVERRGTLISTGPEILYNYGKIPDPDGVSWSSVQVSERTGICFLAQAGTWWLRNNEDPENGASLDCLLIDASNPEVAAKYLRQPGVNWEFQFNTRINDDTIEYVIPTGGRYTRAVTIQNVPDVDGISATLRIGVNTPPGYLNNGVFQGRGLRLLVNGSMTFSHDDLCRGSIIVSLEAAGASALETVQYRDR